MVSVEMMNKFCGLGERISDPFTEGDYTYATNGHIIVRVPKMDAVTKKAMINPTVVPWDHAILTEWKPIEDYPLPEKVVCPDCEGLKKIVCPECDGKGETSLRGKLDYYDIECPLCDGDLNYREECENCDSDGKRYEQKRPRIELKPWDVIVNAEYLYMIKTYLPGPHYLTVNRADQDYPMGIIRFKFEGGEGGVMPMYR